MPEPPGRRFIRSHIRAKRYRLTQHATIARLERGITIADLERARLDGEIIERDPEAQPYPACLVLGSPRLGRPPAPRLFEGGG